ncbi:MAG: Fe-S oxidoreductase [Acidobacteriia bacterium]|nr:Fe-S oxidoreductase [Terriglobia bacterium]
MKELRELAQKLLIDGSVKVVIGYEEGPRGVRPVFVTEPAQAEKLIFDTRCVHNLAAYLNPRRRQIAKLGKPAVVVKGCDARAVAGLIREAQIKREDVVIIAVRCGGVVRDPAQSAALTVDNVSDRCAGCNVREPKLFDHLLGPLPPAPPQSTRREDKLAELAGMTPAERWAFWSGHLDRCIRCHACREVCPMCFCVRCTADRSRPQWIECSPTPQSNRSWQLMRVLHQAGRCVDCLECERACPANIPLGLLNKYVAQVVEQRFGYRSCDDPTVPAPLGVFSTDDQQEFIQ